MIGGKFSGVVLGMTVWFCAAVSAWAAEPQIEHARLSNYVERIYDESTGLGTSEANDLLQTRDGYMWIGSYSGLTRYDSHEFESISKEMESAPQTGIRALYESEDGRLFVGTNDNGLYLFGGDHFSRIGTEEIQGLSIREITEGTDGVIYAGTNRGILMVDKEGNTSFVAGKELEAETIVAVTRDSDGNIWGISQGSEVYVIKDGKLLLHLEPDFFGVELGEAVICARDGHMLIGTAGNQLLEVQAEGSQLKKENLTWQLLDTGSKSNVNCIYEDSYDRLWVGTDSGIGCFRENGVFEEIQGTYENTIVSQICEGYEGNLWFASTRQGVMQLVRTKFDNVSYDAGIQNQTVNSTVLYQNTLYIGTDIGLFLMDEHGEPVKNELTELLSGIRIRNLMKSSTGKLYISTYRELGLVCYDGTAGTWECITMENGLPGYQVRMSVELSNGDIAVATNHGLAMLRDGQVTAVYGEAQGLKNQQILCIAEGADGAVLAGTDGEGIYVIEPESGKLKHFGTEEGLESGVVLRIAADEAAEGFWISNGSALSFMDDSGIRTMPELPEGQGSIFDIKVTEEKLWFLKSSCMLGIKREALLSGDVGNYEVLTRNDGLMSSITSNSWNYMSADGMFFLCTGNGVYYINVNDIYRNEIPPKISVDKVNIDGESIYHQNEIRIPADAQRISIDMDVLSYSLSSGGVWYYLEGFDKEPVYLEGTGGLSVSYTNLPGGTYTFHLRGVNGDHVESTEEKTIRIIKEKSILEQRYLITLGIAGGLLIILVLSILINKTRTKKLLERQREYKALTDQTIRTVANTIDAKDKYTRGHSQRVAALTVEMGRRLGLDEHEQEELYYTALLHDIGKIGVPDEILKKPGKLTEEEYHIIQQHPEIGGEILSNFDQLPYIMEGARYHHERYDGNGYNHGLKGKEIPLCARIIAVADTFDAMNSARIYRESLTMEVIVSELQRVSGSQLDPELTEIMLEMIADGFAESV